MGFLRRFNQFLGNKGHFLLPVAGAALGALKTVGGAALTGAKALGGAALGAGKAIGGGVLKAAKGMLGAGKATTPAMEAAKRALVPGAQNIGMQVSGRVPGQVATSTLGKATRNGIFNAILKSIGQLKPGEEKEETSVQPAIVGGEGPIATPQIPQFNHPVSIGKLIAELLKSSRGF